MWIGSKDFKRDCHIFRSTNTIICQKITTSNSVLLCQRNISLKTTFPWIWRENYGNGQTISTVKPLQLKIYKLINTISKSSHRLAIQMVHSRGRSFILFQILRRGQPWLKRLHKLERLWNHSQSQWQHKARFKC